VNHETIDLNDKIFSAASCTTNAIVPVLKVVNDVFGLEVGHVETIHSYTNDQNLIDNYHKSNRRGRAATLNMVITETGAGSAVAKALPELKGKITGNSIRVPTPDGSLAVLSLTLNTDVTKESLNEALRKASLKGGLVEQIEFSLNNELVSSDIIGNVHASIVDGPATIVQPNGKGAIVYVWYDNEYGYTRQVMRLAKYLGDVIRFTYY
jgi:glyceraldehyde 3-phosphate dehydrogenase